jgi:hypothetical protein
MNPFYSGTRHTHPAMANRYTLLCLLFYLCACSCNMSAHVAGPRTRPLPAVTDDARSAKSLNPPPDKALVYIVRPKRWTSSLPKRMLLNIFFVYPFTYLLLINPDNYQVDYADAMSTGRIPAHGYTYLLLDPGDHTFSPWASFGNWACDSPDLDLLLVPGRTYYLRLDMPSRWFAFHARPRLVLISDEEGRRLLGKCRLIRR